MARDFKALMRINDWEVDQKRRILATHMQQLENLIARLEALEEELIREQELAASSPTEAGLTFGAYATSAIERREALQERIAEQEEIVANAREAVRIAFLEYKKYEIAEERRVAEETAEQTRDEQAELNEIGILAHIRKG